MATEPHVRTCFDVFTAQKISAAGPSLAQPRNPASPTALAATLALAATYAAPLCRHRSGAFGRAFRAFPFAPSGSGSGWTAAITSGRVAGSAGAAARGPSCGSFVLWHYHHQQQHQFQQRRLMSWLSGRGGPAAVNTAASPLRIGLSSSLADSSAPSLARFVPKRLPLPTAGARWMATEAHQAAASSAAAAAAAWRPGLLHRLRGRLGDALRLQMAAAWQSYGKVVYAMGALTAVYLTWRMMHTITFTFIAVNDKMADYGLIGLAVTVVLLASLYLRWRVSISPSAVYRQGLMRLNTSPGVLEVMGAPLVGSPVRAYVVTGGGVYLSKKFRLKLRSRRIQMMFPLSGSERKGLASLEAKRKGGKYVWKLLAVDLGPELQSALPAGGATGLSAAPPPRRPPSSAAPLEHHSRLYVVGDLAAYQRGGVLGELRAPFLNALSNSKSFEVEDELEEELAELEMPKAVHSRTGEAVQKVRDALAAAAAMVTKPSTGTDSAAAAATIGAAAKETGAVVKGRAASVTADAAAAPETKPSPPPTPTPMPAPQGQQQQQQEEVQQGGRGDGGGGGMSLWMRMRTKVAGHSPPSSK